MAKKSALGKGIASLLESNSTTQYLKSFDDKDAFNTAHLKSKMGLDERQAVGQSEKKVEALETPVLLDVSQIEVNQYQPRKIFKETELHELSLSIKENGIIQPLIVSKKENGYELIAGERRLRASKLAGLTKVPVVIKKVTDKEKLVFALIENIQRSELNCVEEALAYYQLMEDFKLTQEEIAKKMGKERSSVANFLRVLKLPRPVIDLLQQERLSFGHAKVLCSVSTPEKIIILAQEVVSKKLSIRELENLIKKVPKLPSKGEPEDSKYDDLKRSLESKTGLHLKLNCKKNGTGELRIKFQSESELNKIYELLMK